MALDTAAAESFEPRIVGIAPEGIGNGTARDIATRIRDVFKNYDGSRVRALRFVPSSLTRPTPNVVSFVANTTVEPKPSRADSPPGRSKVIDSVVTVDLSNPEHGVVTDVQVPFFGM